MESAERIDQASAPPVWWKAGVIVVLLVAVFLRFFMLSEKPPHFDEGINGGFIEDMRPLGFYRFDATHYHGPLHFYVIFASDRLFGARIEALRVPVVLISLATVILALFYARFFGRFVALGAAAVLAVSPGFVFYGRYAIHETWLAFFLMLTVYALFLRAEDPDSPLPERLLGAGLAGMICIKETFIMHVASGFIAYGMLAMVGRFLPQLEWKWPGTDRRRFLPSLIGWTVVPTLLLYSGLLLNPRGVIDLFATFALWVDIGVKSGYGHHKPWFYWLTLLRDYEWAILAGMFGTFLWLFPGDWRARWLALGTAGVFIAYSIVPYKTPWCIISMVWSVPFLLFLAIERLPLGKARFIGGTLAGLLTMATIWPAVRVNYINYTDPKEAYVYVQTHKEIDVFTKPVLATAADDPSLMFDEALIHAIDSYPIGWILQDFNGIGYYGSEEVEKTGKGPATYNVEFFMIDENLREKVEPTLTSSYYRKRFHLRDAQDHSFAYFKAERFAKYFEYAEPEFVPGKETSDNPGSTEEEP